MGRLLWLVIVCYALDNVFLSVDMLVRRYPTQLCFARFMKLGHESHPCEVRANFHHKIYVLVTSCDASYKQTTYSNACLQRSFTIIHLMTISCIPPSVMIGDRGLQSSEANQCETSRLITRPQLYKANRPVHSFHFKLEDILIYIRSDIVQYLISSSTCPSKQ